MKRFLSLNTWKSYVRKRGWVVIAGALTVSLLTLALFRDPILKSYLEGVLSKLNGAPIAIGQLHTKLFQGEITLSNLEVWFPSSSERTLRIDSVKLNVLARKLITRRLWIENMQVEGIRLEKASAALTVDQLQWLHTQSSVGLAERVTTSLYQNLREQIGENPFRSIGKLLSGMDLGSEVQKHTKSLRAHRSLEQFDARLATTGDELRRLVEKLPPVESFAPKSDADIAGWDLNKVNAAAQQTREIGEILGKRYRETENELRGFKNTVDQDIRDLTAKLHLPHLDGSDLTVVLMGATLARFLGQLNYWVDLSRRKMPLAQKKGGATISSFDARSGSIVEFGDGGGPRFWLKSGTIHSARANETVKGDWENLASDPSLVGKPFRLTLNAHLPQENIHNLDVKVLIDHTGDTLQETVALHADRLPVDRLAVNDAGDLQLFLQTGVVKADFNAEFKGDHLDGKLNAYFDQVKYQSNSHFRRIEDTVMNSLADLSHFPLQAEVTGPVEQLRFHTNSELGKRIADALNREFKHQIGAIEDDLRKNILDLVYPRYQAQIAQLVEMKKRFLGVAQDRYELTQVILRKAERLVTREKPARRPAARTAAEPTPESDTEN